MNKIGLAIKAERKRQGHTQKDLGEVIGISQNSISQIEKGATQPHQNTLIKICKALGVSKVKMILASLTDEELLLEIERRFKR